MTLLFLLSIFLLALAYLGLIIYPFYILFNLHSCNHYLFNFSGRQDVLPMQWHCWRGPVLCREYKLHHYRLRGNGNLCKIDIHAKVNAKLFLFPLKTNYSILGPILTSQLSMPRSETAAALTTWPRGWRCAARRQRPARTSAPPWRTGRALGSVWRRSLAAAVQRSCEYFELSSSSSYSSPNRQLLVGFGKCWLEKSVN